MNPTSQIWVRYCAKSRKGVRDQESEEKKTGVRSQSRYRDRSQKIKGRGQGN